MKLKLLLRKDEAFSDASHSIYACRAELYLVVSRLPPDVTILYSTKFVHK